MDPVMALQGSAGMIFVNIPYWIFRWPAGRPSGQT
jgi:hypothetical protein